jgi:hypothetical protein
MGSTAVVFFRCGTSGPLSRGLAAQPVRKMIVTGLATGEHSYNGTFYQCYFVIPAFIPEPFGFILLSEQSLNLILCKINPVYILTVCKIHFNIIL